MSNVQRLTFEQAWTVISDIAKACREFNELQFKYQQLALSLVLAAYAAIGYFWISSDTGATPSSQQVGTLGNAEAPKAGEHASASQGGQTTSPPSPEVVRRLSLIFFGIGLLTAFSSSAICVIDARYHHFLEANFDAAKSFEARLEGSGLAAATPRIHQRMWTYTGEGRVILAMIVFYYLIALAGLLPWYAYTFLHREAWDTGWANSANLSLGLAVAFLFLFFGFVYRSALSKSGAMPGKDTPVDGEVDGSMQAAPAGVDKELLDAARQAHANAYGEYSGFCVGAAVLAHNGADRKVFAGCNVENASYGLTICAERNAIAAAVAAGYPRIERVLVYTDTDQPTAPCGACLQVIQEFGQGAEVILRGRQAEKRFAMAELLPTPSL